MANYSTYFFKMTKNSEKIYFFSLQFQAGKNKIAMLGTEMTWHLVVIFALVAEIFSLRILIFNIFYCSAEVKFGVLLSEFEISEGFSSAETGFCASGSAFLGSGAGGFGSCGTFDKSAVVSKVLGPS